MISSMHSATYATQLSMTNPLSSASARALLVSTLLGTVPVILIWGERGVA